MPFKEPSLSKEHRGQVWPHPTRARGSRSSQMTPGMRSPGHACLDSNSDLGADADAERRLWWTVRAHSDQPARGASRTSTSAAPSTARTSAEPRPRDGLGDDAHHGRLHATQAGQAAGGHVGGREIKIIQARSSIDVVGVAVPSTVVFATLDAVGTDALGRHSSGKHSSGCISHHSEEVQEENDQGHRH